MSQLELYTLAHGLGIPGSETLNRTMNTIHLDNNLVEGCDEHVSVRGIHAVPHPNLLFQYHAQTYDEILMFLGTYPPPLEDLRGEVERAMGDEEEGNSITKTSAVLIPKGLKHVPACKRVEGPRLLVAISMSGEYK